MHYPQKNVNDVHDPIGTGKRGHIVADTLLTIVADDVSWAAQTGSICCGHKMFLNKIRNIFLCLQQMLRPRANGETFVSTTMFPQQCVLVCQGLIT